MRTLFSSLLLASCLVASQLGYAEEKQALRLATTTSTDNSGLLAYLLPEFKKDTDIDVQVIAVGTGKALRMGRDGDVDVVLVHAKSAEDKFVAEGHGIERHPVMYNDFVLLGAEDDPAKLAEAQDIKTAMSRIAENEATFVSRGDDSGTHKKEKQLWVSAEVEPTGSWYREAGQGMGKVIQMSGELGAYTMADRGTWLATMNKSPLKVVFEGDETLFNPYGIIAVSPEKYPDINKGGADALINWMTSEKGQQMIGTFKISGKQLFVPSAKTAVAEVKPEAVESQTN